MSTAAKIALITGIILVVIILMVVVVSVMNPAAPSAPVANPPTTFPIKLPPIVPQAKPRTTNVADCGYPSRPRGWYDVQGQGARNDFCRFVGDLPGWFTCKLAGSNVEMTPQGKYPSTKGDEPHDPYTGGFTGRGC